ncbi:MAG: hypothetical protein IJ167_03755 [Lachnospiraceae bacterium]|nr:hypothetical protein [Lachnospiraceae bacterium]
MVCSRRTLKSRHPLKRFGAFIMGAVLILGFSPTGEISSLTEEEFNVTNAVLIVNSEGKLDTENSSVADTVSIDYEEDGIVFLAYDSTNEVYVPCEEDSEDWVIVFDATDEATVIGLRNFKYQGADSPFNLYDYFGDVVISLEGDNEIVMTDCDGLETQGSLIFAGEGDLNIENKNPASHDEEDNPIIDDEGNPVVPAALFVGLAASEETVFVNECTGIITCKAEGNFDFNLGNLTIPQVINKGNVNGRGTIPGVDEFTNLVPYTTTYTEPERAGYEMKGKAYYYCDDDNLMWPNNIFGTLGDGIWRYVGEYDEDGAPIPSNDMYQNYMVNKRGIWLTMDFDNQYAFLVYGTTAEKDALPTPDDIVSVQDSEEEHTFNTDLYWALMVEGSMTINGNITGELTLMENSYHIDIDEETDAFAYDRDEDGNILFMDDSTGAKAEINGDVGFLALNKSYKGDASINGKLMGISYQDDVNVKDYELCDCTIYAASAKAGQLVKDGEFTPGTIEVLEGYQETAVYDEEFCYVMTERELDGEEVVGTTAIVGDSALLVDVTKEELPPDTHPLVRELDKADEKAVLDKLPETDNALVMDIALIAENTEEIEPEAPVNLYFDNLGDFENPVVYHIKDDGTAEKVYTHEGSFDGSLKVPVESFSVYVVAEETIEEKPEEPEEPEKPEEPKEPETPAKTSTGTVSSEGILVLKDSPSIVAGMVHAKSDANDDVEFKWVACEENTPDKWFEISPWTKNNEWLNWTPDEAGNYVIVCQARIVGNEEKSLISKSVGVVYSKHVIKDICQIPYEDGYLIGFESTQNPNQSYQYEMLVMDLTLFASGNPNCWILSTGRATVSEGNAIWITWKPEYGYYLTLFRVYDGNGRLLDQQCYGFANAY